MESLATIDIACIDASSAREVFIDHEHLPFTNGLVDMYLDYARIAGLPKKYQDTSSSQFGSATAFAESAAFEPIHEAYEAAATQQADESMRLATEISGSFITRMVATTPSEALLPGDIAEYERELSDLQIHLQDPLSLIDDILGNYSAEQADDTTIDLHQLAKRSYDNPTGVNMTHTTAFYWGQGHHIKMPIIASDTDFYAHIIDHEMQHALDTHGLFLRNGFNDVEILEDDVILRVGSMLTEGWAEYRNRRMRGLDPFAADVVYGSEIVAMAKILQIVGEKPVQDYTSPRNNASLDAMNETERALMDKLDETMGADFLYRFEAALAVHGVDKFAAMNNAEQDDFMATKLVDIDPVDIIPTIEKLYGPITE